MASMMIATVFMNIALEGAWKKYASVIMNATALQQNEAVFFRRI
jgi:hypothetical protein